VLTAWRLGSAYNSSGQCGFVIAEYAVLDSLLTADEIAALYILNKPLVDAGATDKPGIYLYDGKFALASSETGARTVIDTSGIWAYDASNNHAFGLSLQDGVSWGGFTINKSDLVLGHNRSGSAAILWDQSAGTFGFYGNANATAQLTVSTTGTLTAGAGAITLASTGMLVASSGDGTNHIKFSNSDITDYESAYGLIRLDKTNVQSGTTGAMVLGLWNDANNYSAVEAFEGGVNVGLNEGGAIATPLLLTRADIVIGDAECTKVTFGVPTILYTKSGTPSVTTNGTIYFDTSADALVVKTAAGWKAVAFL